METVGDAYVVGSGLPVENGTRHAVETAKMALDLLAKLLTFEVKHKPGYKLKTKMGMHSGKVVGGLVGTKIPHYSVIGMTSYLLVSKLKKMSPGHTVEMAGMMERTGEPMKIQITERTRELLLDTGGFNIQYRGEYIDQHIGLVFTYWLKGKTE